jgi:hypothetical protein
MVLRAKCWQWKRMSPIPERHTNNSEVVVNRGVITSRNPDDLDAFSRKIIEAWGTPQQQAHCGLSPEKTLSAPGNSRASVRLHWQRNGRILYV